MSAIKENAMLIENWLRNRTESFTTKDAFDEIDEIFNVKDVSDSLRYLYQKGFISRKRIDGGKFLYCNTKHAPKGFERFKDAALKNPVIKRDVEIVEEKQEIINGEDEMKANKVEETVDQIQIGGDHYKSQNVQPWDAMEAWMSQDQFKGFLRGNVIKYIARCEKKGGVEDLKKARHYLDKLIEVCES